MRSFNSKVGKRDPKILLFLSINFLAFIPHICRLFIVEYGYEYHVVDYILSMKKIGS